MNNITKLAENLLIPTVRNLEEARAICLDYDAVLTSGPDSSEVQFGHPIHKVVQFHDTIDPVRGPSFENVTEMMDFGIGVPKLLVHCHAGISRSTATAWGVAIGNGIDPLEAFLTLKLHHPSTESSFSGFRGGKRTFAPNRLLVSHLEKYFNLDGVLIKIRNKYSSTGW